MSLNIFSVKVLMLKFKKKLCVMEDDFTFDINATEDISLVIFFLNHFLLLNWESQLKL